MNISLKEELITDAGLSGSDFDRPGIKEILKLVDEYEVDYLVVTRINRLGRDALKTINLIGRLRTEFGVKLVTNRFKELDFAKHEHRPIIITQAGEAQRTNESRSESAQRGVIQSFKNKNWNAVYDKPPYGYESTNQGWIRPKMSAAANVRKIFGTFVSATPSRAYTETAEAFPRQDFTTSQVKEIVSNEIYVGWAIAVIMDTCGLSTNLFAETKYERELVIVSDDLFEMAQRKIERLDELNGVDDTQRGLEKLEGTMESVPALITFPEMTLRCPNCGQPMTKNGTPEDPERLSHYYRCSDCGNERLFPKKRELRRLESELSDFKHYGGNGD